MSASLLRALLLRTATLIGLFAIIAPAPSGPLHAARAAQPTDTFPFRLVGSELVAAQPTIAFGEAVLFTLILRNAGDTADSVDVTVWHPADLAYVSGSAADASYDEQDQTLIWSDIALDAQGEAQRTFKLTPTHTVSLNKLLPVIAGIMGQDEHLVRTATITLVPGDGPPSDLGRPTVSRVVIGAQDVLTDRSTTVHIEASDDVGVSEIYLREWQLVTWSGPPRWQAVQSSGWLPFQPDVAWELAGEPGTHFVGAWARDAAGNVSTLGQQGVDFASLVLPDTAVAAHQSRLYMVAYVSGVPVEISLAPRSGDADLYVWYPDSWLLPDAESENEGAALDQVSFTTPRAGVYLVAVLGYSDARYDLSFSAAGGPHIAQAAGAPAIAQAARPSPRLVDLIGDLSLSPVDDVSAESPAVVERIYVPALIRP